MSQTAKKRLRRESLTMRLLLVTGGLVVGTALILSALAIYLLGAESERSLQARLNTAQGTADRLIQQRVDEASRLAQWLGRDSLLAQAVRDQHSTALDAFAVRMAATHPATWLLVTDATGRRLTQTFWPALDPPSAFGADALQGKPSAGLMATTDCQIHALASAPVHIDEMTVGALIVASALDDDFAEQLRAQTQMTAWLLCGSSERATLFGASALEIDPLLAETVFQRGQTYVGSSRVDGVASYGYYAPLLDTRGRVIGMYGLSQPVQEIVSARDNAARIFIGLALILAALVLGEAYLLSRQITRPLSALIHATRALGEGDLATPLTMRGNDELALLAQTFETMRARLAETYADLARERNRYRDFLAIMPHEFKTPLAALAASLELLEMDERSLTAEQKTLLGSIQRSVIRLHSLVDNLLDSASIQAGQFHVQVKPSDLRAIIADARLFTQPLLDQKDQSLELSTPADLPWVMADARRMTQVLINLISNAHKYGPSGVPIRVETRVAERHVRVSVSDCGAGIPPDEQRDLFQRFMRASSRPAGLGFGLAIAREIIEQHQGQIGLESAVAKGTTIWFTLPMATTPAPLASIEQYENLSGG